MKKLLTLLVISFVVCGSCGIATALETSNDTVAINLPVLGQFAVYIAAPQITMSETAAGDIAFEQFSISCVNTFGVDWDVKLSNTTFTDGTNIIPINAVDGGCYFGLSFPDGGQGEDVPGGTSAYLYDNGDFATEGFPGATPAVIYDSAAAEMGSFYFTGILKFELGASLPQGTYQTSLTFDMVQTP